MNAGTFPPLRAYKLILNEVRLGLMSHFCETEGQPPCDVCAFASGKFIHMVMIQLFIKLRPSSTSSLGTFCA